MRSAAALLFNATLVCALSATGCEVLYDASSFVGNAGSSDASSGGSAQSNAGNGGAGAAGTANSAGAAGNSVSAGNGGAGADNGGAPNGAGAPNTAGSAGSSTCKVTNKGKEICDGIDNDCNPATPDCPAGCSLFTSHGTNYMACDKLEKWQNAELVCFQESMQLLEIDSALQNQGILSALQGLGFGPEVWLAAQDSSGDGTISWTDGTVIAKGKTFTPGVYQNFASGQPTSVVGGSCVQMDVSSGTTAGTWANVPCTAAQQFACMPFAAGLL